MRSQGRSHEKRELPAQLRTHTARCTDGYSAASCQKDAEKDSFARTCTAKKRKRETMETTGRRLASMYAAAGSERSPPLCEQPAYDLNPTSREKKMLIGYPQVRISPLGSTNTRGSASSQR